MLNFFRLPYFHMNECNMGKGEFTHLGEDECDQCAREAIRIARKYTLHGHSFVLDQTEYREVLQDEGFDCDPYTFMVWSAYTHVNRWVHENRQNERITLFFENGYKTQPRANELLRLLADDEWGGKNHLEHYEFVDKAHSEPSQAADLIAWHVRRGYENLRAGKAVRPDTRALIDGKTILTIEWTREVLLGIRRKFCETSGNLERAAKTLFSTSS